MSIARNQLLLILLQLGEPISSGMLYYNVDKYVGRHGDRKPINSSLAELEGLGVICRFEVDLDDIANLAFGSHEEHGDIELSTIKNVSGLEEMISLSTGASSYIVENIASLTSAAAELGLDRALQALSAMPIDSTAWTGHSRGFLLTDETRIQMQKLIETSLRQIENSNYSNLEVAQASGLLKSVLILMQMPEPPKTDIWSLINKGASIASIASLFIPLLKFLRP